MARSLRLEFPGAIYHVTSRGNAQQAVFADDEDRERFLAILGETVTHFGWLCHAYCLMDNHYHLIIETPDGNLSPGMRQLNGVYTQRFNRRHGRVGHLFQGRFKSILVDRDSYLLELCRYVVLNPIRAKMVKKLDGYPWSSYPATIGNAPVPNWLATDWVLSQFGRNRAAARQKYVAFVAEGKMLPSPWQALKGQVLLGSEGFVERMGTLLGSKSDLKEIPRSQRFAHRPSLADMFPTSTQGNKPARDVAIRRAYLEFGYTLASIAKQAGVHYSTVSKVIKGVR
ncbi:MAG: transposase [Sulfuricella sp.]|nr:transposase [Sulfuricella sp.]MDD5328689.1 transposase [Sulfuricella sp.]